MILDTERRRFLAVLTSGLAWTGIASVWPLKGMKENRKPNGGIAMKLPPPRAEGAISVEKALDQRRTVRDFSGRSLSLSQFSQLLWAAQGITGGTGFRRAAPSAGALYPMDVYAVVGPESVENIEAGVYHYLPDGHKIVRTLQQDLRKPLARAALSQMWMADAPLQLVITAEYGRVTVKYGERGVRYAMMEAGHIGQNVFLQAEALGLKAGIVGAFREDQISKLLALPTAHEALLIMPVGYAAI